MILVAFSQIIMSSMLIFLKFSGGYPNDPGSIPADPKGLSRSDCSFVPGFNEALCFVFRSDNTGPPESVQVYSTVLLSCALII